MPATRFDKNASAAVGPIATVALGMLVLGERINAWQVAGAVLVIAGVLMITIRPGPA